MKYSKYCRESECANARKKEDFWQPFSKPYQNFITFSSHNWFAVMNKLMQYIKRLIYDKISRWNGLYRFQILPHWLHPTVCVWKGENGSLWIKCSDEDKQERISNSNMKPSFVCELKINVFLSQNLLGTNMWWIL